MFMVTIRAMTVMTDSTTGAINHIDIVTSTGIVTARAIMSMIINTFLQIMDFLSSFESDIRFEKLNVARTIRPILSITSKINSIMRLSFE